MAKNNGYIDMTNAKNISGATMLSAKKGKFLRIVVDGEKRLVRANTHVINEHGVYTVKLNRHGEAVISTENGWSCSQEMYNSIMNDGNDIINRIFGDLPGFND